MLLSSKIEAASEVWKRSRKGWESFLWQKNINKVTSHSMGNKAHLLSIAFIPRLTAHSIFIEERPPKKITKSLTATDIMS